MANWVSTLSTSSIAADMADAVNDGVVSYDELLKLFSDVEATLEQAGRTLTAAEFSDLQIVAANLNNGVSTSDYLVCITRALVDGNLANAFWTGGEISAVPLGNLAAGASATQLEGLVGKWFLGTDLPAAMGFFGEYPTFTAVPLFGPNGPEIEDISQGLIGDCYFLACLAEIASQHPDAIVSMFTDNGNGTYGVRFYIDGAASYVTVDNQLLGLTYTNGSIAPLLNRFNPDGASLWAGLVEKAFAQLAATTTTGITNGGNPKGPGNTWESISGGWTLFTLAEITGAGVVAQFHNWSGSWTATVYDSSLGALGTYRPIDVIDSASLSAWLVDALAAGNDILMGSMVNADDASSGLHTLIEGHTYSIYGYDAVTGMFEVRNPWGDNLNPIYYAKTFEISLDALLAVGTISIEIDNANRGLTPLLGLQTSAQTWSSGQAVNFTLAANTFIELEGQTLTYSATLADDSALPSWLKFDPVTGTFTGTVASTATDFGIKVTATDSEGLSTSEWFDVAIPSLKLVAQTPAQYWNQAVNFTLPANTFSDSAGQKLVYTATLANGSALPSWLKFDPTSGTFTGVPPGNPLAFDVKVTAIDVSGLKASETFSIYALGGATVTMGTAGNDTINLSGTSENNIITGGSGGYDRLYGGNGNDILVAGPGSTIYGGSGNDILDGQGDLYGESGDDVYIIRSDTFNSRILDAYGQDTILFKDIKPEDLSVYWSSNGMDAVFQLNSTGMELTVMSQNPQYSPYSNSHIENYIFSDGTIWDYSQLVDAASKSLLLAQTPTQYWTHTVDFTLPADTFSDSMGQKPIYTATLADGSALPSWLKFDSVTGTFTGMPPDTPSAFDVKVTATDISGLKASETFSIYALGGATVTMGTAGNDTINLSGTSGNNIITGGSGGYDRLYGGNGNDILVAGPGSIIYGGSGNDILDGQGDLYGESGDDVYIIRSDTFNSRILDAYGQDTILFKDIKPEDLSVYWSSNGMDAVLQLNSTGMELTVMSQNPQYSPYSNSHIENYIFSDGTIWDYSQLVDAASAFVLVGSALSPALIGNALGTNTFQFGTGHEIAYGGERSNVYQISASTGQAEINMSTAAGSKNELDFLAGITDENLWFKQSGNDLEIDVLGTNTSVMVNGWFSGHSGALQEITAGGLKIDNQISQLVQAMASYSANNPGFNPTSSAIHTLPGDSGLQSTLAAAWH
jgi:hypothetical protein